MGAQIIIMHLRIRQTDTCSCGCRCVRVHCHLYFLSRLIYSYRPLGKHTDTAIVLLVGG